MSLDWFQKWAQYSPSKIAIKEWNGGRSMSYLALDQWSEYWSQFFSEQGFKKGDRIGILSEFRLEYFILFGMAQKTGIILVPLNYRLSGRELDYMISDSGCSLLLVESQFAENAQELNLPKTPIESLYSEGEMPALNRYSGVPVLEEDPLFILYTSGTTGFPKGAIYTHKMAIWNSLNTAMRLELTAKDHCLQVMPPFHTGGWNVLSSPLLHFGGSLCLMPKFEAQDCLKALQQEAVSLFMAVPTMVRMLSEAPNFAESQLPALRYFIVGGEALPIPLIDKWAQKGVAIRQGYGLTEVGPNVSSLNAEDALRKRGSIGFINFYYEWKLCDDAGHTVPQGEQGELWLKGPCVSPAYWQNPEATKKSKEGDWFKTGDILVEDREGFLYLVDRKKNMYISGGENIYPSEIEHYLRKHPALKELAVIGVPDPKWGEVGCAFFVSEEEIQTEDLKAYCAKGLARFKIPKHFKKVEELPKNSSGKIDRMALQKRFESES